MKAYVSMKQSKTNVNHKHFRPTTLSRRGEDEIDFKAKKIEPSIRVKGGNMLKPFTNSICKQKLFVMLVPMPARASRENWIATLINRLQSQRKQIFPFSWQFSILFELRAHPINSINSFMRRRKNYWTEINFPLSSSTFFLKNQNLTIDNKAAFNHLSK